MIKLSVLVVLFVLFCFVLTCRWMYCYWILEISISQNCAGCLHVTIWINPFFTLSMSVQGFTQTLDKYFRTDIMWIQRNSTKWLVCTLGLIDNSRSKNHQMVPKANSVCEEPAADGLPLFRHNALQVQRWGNILHYQTSSWVKKWA